MGKGGDTCPLWKCCKVCLCIAKRSVDELFMHYFHNMSSASGGFVPDPTGPPSLDPARGLSFQIHNLPTHGKKSCGYHLVIRTHFTALFLCCCRIELQYKLYCDADYYTSDCTVYCVANDTDAGSLYTCDPITGNIVCRSGMLTGRLRAQFVLILTSYRESYQYIFRRVGQNEVKP